MKTAIILINGILTDPRRDDAWTDAGEFWLGTHTDGVVVNRYEYNGIPLLSIFGQNRRAKKVIEIVKGYTEAGDRVILVGHSNGCDIIARVIAETQVDEVHLISPATDEASIEKGIAAGRVGLVFIYGSTGDMALKYGARASRVITLGLGGYGSLGLRGPALAAKWPGIVRDFSNNSYGHGTWIDGTHLEQTLTLICKNSDIPLT